jgi:hypothetical protein
MAVKLIYSHKSGPSQSRAYCIFAQLTNSNVLGKLPIHDSNNRVNWELLLVVLAKILYARDGDSVKDQIYEKNVE